MNASSTQSSLDLNTRLVNILLAIKPVAKLLKWQARNVMIKQGEKLGVPWRETVQQLRDHDWQAELNKVKNSELTYPEHYLRSFHGYERGHLSWDAAWECEVAARTVHSRLWQDIGIEGDQKLRQNYHDLLVKYFTAPPQDILDIHCTAGMSSFALQALYPNAQVTGLDFSPYYLAVANYNSQTRNSQINWVHTLPESTGLPDAYCDLVSSFLFFHELPQSATLKVIREINRLLRPGGYFAMMDIDPQAEFYQQIPAYVLTILKSTEPYLDEYFTLNFPQALRETGFQQIEITAHSKRYRAVLAKKS